MGILRNSMIIGAIAIAMPAPPPSERAGVIEPQASTIAYVSAASDTFADVRTFCQRKPGVCETAGHVAATMEAKAKYSAKLIYEWANEAAISSNGKSALSDELASADPIATGTRDHVRPARQSQSTLILSDILPEWQAPVNKPQPKKG
jgi:Family of unknown function (DUF5330)